MLFGAYGYAAGANGSPTLPKGAQITKIIAHASAGGATVAINGGDAIPVINGAEWLNISLGHLLLTAKTTTPVVFTGTDSFYIEWINPGVSAS